MVGVKIKADRERYVNQLADEGEEGLNYSQLKGAYQAIKQISGKSTNQQCPINKASRVLQRRRPLRHGPC